MPWIRLLLLSALSASAALPGHANEGHDACADRVTGADSDADPIACAHTRRAAADPSMAAPAAPAPGDDIVLDCNPFVLGGLAATGMAGSPLASAAIRHCSLRGYGLGVALLAPTTPDTTLRR